MNLVLTLTLNALPSLRSSRQPVATDDIVDVYDTTTGLIVSQVQYYDASVASSFVQYYNI
jgi:hypothetical protein